MKPIKPKRPNELHETRGNRITRMEDIANEAGVSLMTVSRALKPNTSVAPATRERIQAVVKRLGYVPDFNAGSLAARRSGFVSLLVPSLNNPHFAETAMGMKEVLEPYGLQVLLGHTNYQAGQEQLLVQAMLRRRPEAIVLTYDGHSVGTRRLLKEAAIPVIDIWETPVKPVGHVVGFSNRAASRAMTEHLIAQAYKRIAYIGESHDEGTRGTLRRLGFIDALENAGLDTSRQIAQAPPPINMDQGSAALASLLSRWPDTEAVMCVSDPCAFGVLAECQRRGIKVPKQLAIAGFGAFEISAACVPAISTLGFSGREMGHEAAKLIIDLLAHQGDKKATNTAIKNRTVLIKTEVLARPSTLRSIKHTD